MQNIERCSYDPHVERLKNIDWNFLGVQTNYLTHGLHPYPAKFVPQIPNALIQELSNVGDTVADIFCGSGTTLVEALILKRNAVGIDANPLACLISTAKTIILEQDDLEELFELKSSTSRLIDSINDDFKSQYWRPAYPKLSFWFDNFVIEELAELFHLCSAIKGEKAKSLALCVFSAIIVAVSRQDSDTRYVRREKSLKPTDTIRKFISSLTSAIKASVEFSAIAENRFKCSIIHESALNQPIMPNINLIVCSPPYPNAYSYHLYHMTRMIWLQMDQPKFKQEEIGSHRKYSSKGKNAANEDTFKYEFNIIMNWISRFLKNNGYACFVVGDSTIAGKVVDNAEIISQAANLVNLTEVARIGREIQSTKKSFNPVIGKIKKEKILILKKCV